MRSHSTAKFETTSRKQTLKLLALTLLTLSTAAGMNNAAFADSAPAVPEGVFVEEDVDLTQPHVDAPSRSRSATSCNVLYSAITPLGFSFSGEFRWLACSYWGYKKKKKKNYQWYVSPQSSSMACAQGMGFRSGAPYWASLGCGESGAKALDWGMVIAYPKIKVMSLSGLIVPIYWN